MFKILGTAIQMECLIQSNVLFFRSGSKTVVPNGESKKKLVLMAIHTHPMARAPW